MKFADNGFPYICGFLGWRSVAQFLTSCSALCLHVPFLLSGRFGYVAFIRYRAGKLCLANLGEKSFLGHYHNGTFTQLRASLIVAARTASIPEDKHSLLASAFWF